MGIVAGWLSGVFVESGVVDVDAYANAFAENDVADARRGGEENRGAAAAVALLLRGGDRDAGRGFRIRWAVLGRGRLDLGLLFVL